MEVPACEGGLGEDEDVSAGKSKTGGEDVASKTGAASPLIFVQERR